MTKRSLPLYYESATIVFKTLRRVLIGGDFFDYKAYMYTNVTKKGFERIESPLDNLNLGFTLGDDNKEI